MTEAIKQWVKRRLSAIIQWQIRHSFFTNHGRYKEGDYVIYSWRAHIELGRSSFIREKFGKVFRVTKILYSDKSNVEFEDGDSCAAFWVRPATKREIKKYLKTLEL